MFFRMVIADSHFGMVLGRHKSNDAAERYLDGDCRMYGFEAVKVIESDDKLEVGQCYPDLAQATVGRLRHRRGVVLMCELLKLRMNGGAEKELRTFSDSLVHYGWSLHELEKECGEAAQAELDNIEAVHQKIATQKAESSAVADVLSKQVAEYTHSFPAVAGVQAGRVYFVAQVPYSVFVKLFRFDEESQEIPPQLRAQRKLSIPRGKKVSAYMVQNPEDYVLPAITACCNKGMRFEPVDAAHKIGMLHIPMDASLLINDGQHRRYGISEAIAINPSLRNETIAVTLHYDQGLKRSQQMFSDINMNAAKPSRSLSSVYDHRDEFKVWCLALIHELEGVRDRIEYEADSVGANSTKCWSLIAFQSVVQKLIGCTSKGFLKWDVERRNNARELVLAFFDGLSHLPGWSHLVRTTGVQPEYRRDTIIAHVLFLDALALAASELLSQTGSLEAFGKLSTLSTEKTADCWQGVALVGGVIKKTAVTTKLTAAEILLHLEVKLPPEWKSLRVEVLADT